MLPATLDDRRPYSVIDAASGIVAGANSRPDSSAWFFARFRDRIAQHSAMINDKPSSPPSAPPTAGPTIAFSGWLTATVSLVPNDSTIDAVDTIGTKIDVADGVPVGDVDPPVVTPEAVTTSVIDVIGDSVGVGGDGADDEFGVGAGDG